MRCNHSQPCRPAGPSWHTQPQAATKHAAILLALGAAVLLPGTAAAQITLPEPAQVKPQPKGEGRYQGSYDESTSRELFRACDTNSDDRLDIFETAEAFDVLPTPRDLQGFARLDTDRDGYVSWPEFDQRFQKGLEHGGTFVVHTSRPFALPEPPPQPLTPLQRFIRLYDKDGDGGLSTAEIMDLVKAIGMPEMVALVLIQCDLDKSGKVDEKELAPWFYKLPKPATATPDNTATGLKQPWLDADGNLDQVIEQTELSVLLRRLDPGLLRWTKEFVAKLDRNKNGKLDANELQQVDVVEDAPSPLPTQLPSKLPTVPGNKPLQAPQR